jgi:hypothetical protein
MWIFDAGMLVRLQSIVMAVVMRRMYPAFLVQSAFVGEVSTDAEAIKQNREGLN